MNRMTSTQIAPAPVQVRPRTVHVSTGLVAAWWGTRHLWAAVTITARSLLLRTIAVSTLATVLLAATLHPGVPVAFWTILAATATILRFRYRPRWDALVGRLRSSWRELAIYLPRWQAAMVTAGLTLKYADQRRMARCLNVTSTPTVDRVRLEMVPGQVLEDFARVSERLAQTFGAHACRVGPVPGHPHRLELHLLTCDPLTDTVPPIAPDGDLNAGIPVGRCEDGTTYRIPLRGTHVLCVGATGSGKGSVIWSTLLGLKPSVDAGTAEVWALDPKGGMELAAGQPMFARWIHGSLDGAYETAFAEALEDAVQLMRQRQDRLRGVTRLHEPTPDDPLIVLVIDELASLTAWVADRTLKRRLADALNLLLSQGRAVGVVVLAAIQDPRKDVLPSRDLFPTRIALRLTEAEQAHLVLGRTTVDAGARPDLIPDTLPGIGYAHTDGTPIPTRLRFSHITDNHITATLPVA